MPGELDVPLGWSQRRLDEHLAECDGWRNLENAVRFASETLGEIDPLTATLTKQREDFEAIRAPLCDAFLACSPRSRDRAEMDKAQALKLSILAIDGRVDLNSAALPVPFPLFVELEKLGYHGVPASPWNPMSAMFGSLPSITRRLEQLEKRRVEAQGVLDAAARRVDALAARDAAAQRAAVQA